MKKEKTLFEIANAITKNEIVNIDTIKKLTRKYKSVHIKECSKYYIVSFEKKLNGTKFAPSIIKKEAK